MDDEAGASDVFEIANEFAAVEVRRLQTRNGVRLEIRVPRTDRSVTLDAMALEGLTWQTPEALSALLARGGPYGDPDERAPSHDEEQT